jgi:hypothetical protein
MKKIVLLLILASTVCVAVEPTPLDKATAYLIKADDLFKAHHLTEAAKMDLEVFKVKGLPDEVYSSAFLLMGNIGLTAGQLDLAEIAYKKVLDLKKASNHDKQAALSGINLVGDLKRDAEREGPHIIYK